METKPPFNVVIVYEDFAAGKHAKETYDYLVHQLGRDFDFTNQMWKFDLLGNSKMNELAVKDAVMADLIIVSTHGKDELPEEVKSWIEHWVILKSNAMALVYLVDQPSIQEAPEAAVTRSYLQDAARRAAIGFFAQPNDWPDQDDDYSLQQFSERAERTSSFMADLIQHNSMGLQYHSAIPVYAGTARWGINE
ncbi:MAG TPA: hypothetical protein VFB72_06230 [Verrucomicrobiae bacterium]|nr:hypothetical protein [Verrucomicrobiae bacterium]